MLMNLKPGLDEDFDCFVVTVEASVMQAGPSTFVTIVNLASLVKQEGDQDKLKRSSIQQDLDHVEKYRSILSNLTVWSLSPTEITNWDSKTLTTDEWEIFSLLMGT